MRPDPMRPNRLLSSLVRSTRRGARVSAPLVLVLALLGARAQAQDLYVRGGVVHTAAGAPLEDGAVLVRDGKVVAVAPAAELPAPEGVRVLEAAVVTPGLVDAHSVVGLAGWLNHEHDQDQLEGSAPVQPELRAVDAFDPREPLVAWIRGFGVTTVHTGHGPGAVVSGQTLVAKTRGDTVDEAVLVPRAMVAATLGESATRDGSEVPGTRSKAVAVLRSELVAAQAYMEQDAPDRDLRLEALAAVLRGDVPLLVTAHRANDLLTALRVGEEFGLRLVLDGAAEVATVLDEVRAAGVPVLLHPTMTRPVGEAESLSVETAAALAAAGVPFALQSGFEGYVPKTRVVLFEAAVAAANGLSFEQALAAITLDAARILGVDDRVGSLEPGKDGDLALYDGDPFEYTTHCVGVVIEGEVVEDQPR